MSGPIRAAVVGGHRGSGYGRAFDTLSDRITLAAICDIDPDVLAVWRANRPDIKTFGRLEDLLDADACDAIFLATPVDLHAGQAIQSLQAGKHVLSEVIAASTIEDCWALVEAVERSGRTYMLAENYCYTRSTMMIGHLIERGEVARGAGHGGGDYFVVEDFVNAVESGGSPAIDVYDAVAWSSVFPLSVESAREGGRPRAIPRFRR